MKLDSTNTEISPLPKYVMDQLKEEVDDFLWGRKEATDSSVWEEVAKHVMLELGLDEIPRKETDRGYHLHYIHCRFLVLSVLQEVQRGWIHY